MQSFTSVETIRGHTKAVEALKRQIPHPDREWHAEGRYWRVKAAHEAWLVRFAQIFPLATSPTMAKTDSVGSVKKPSCRRRLEGQGTADIPV